MTIVDLLIVGLAVWGGTEWVMHAAYWQTLRMKLAAHPRTPTIIRLGLDCGYCISHWVAVAFVILWWWCSWPGALIVLVFAAARLANLANDLTKKINRTPEGGLVTRLEHLDDDKDGTSP
jgi:hypothetical protein